MIYLQSGNYLLIKERFVDCFDEVSKYDANSPEHAVPVPEKKGYVYSPYHQDRMLDVIDIAPGTVVKDPETEEIYIVP